MEAMTAKRRSRRKVLVILLAIVVAAIGYRFLVIGDNRAADKFWSLAPASWRIRHVADKLFSNDPTRSKEAEAALLALWREPDISALIECAAARYYRPDGESGRLCDILGRIGAPAAVPLVKGCSRARRILYAGGMSFLERWTGLSRITSFFADSRRGRYGALFSVSFRALHNMGNSAIKPLTQYVDMRADGDDRETAIYALTYTGNPAAVALIVAFADSGKASASEREEVLLILSSQPIPAAADYIFEQMESLGKTYAPSPGRHDDYATAAVALGRLKDPRAISGLIGVARSANSPFKAQAVTLLGDYQGQAVEAALAAALNDPDDAVSDAAAGALGRIGTQSARDALSKRAPRKNAWR